LRCGVREYQWTLRLLSHEDVTALDVEDVRERFTESRDQCAALEHVHQRRRELTQPQPVVVDLREEGAVDARLEGVLQSGNEHDRQERDREGSAHENSRRLGL